MNNQYELYIYHTINNIICNDALVNNNKIIKFLLPTINNKIEHITLHSSKDRIRRGLGLRILFKFDTGNLDAEDNKMIKLMQINEPFEITD